MYTDSLVSGTQEKEREALLQTRNRDTHKVNEPWRRRERREKRIEKKEKRNEGMKGKKISDRRRHRDTKEGRGAELEAMGRKWQRN